MEGDDIDGQSLNQIDDPLDDVPVPEIPLQEDPVPLEPEPLPQSSQLAQEDIIMQSQNAKSEEKLIQSDCKQNSPNIQTEIPTEAHQDMDIDEQQMEQRILDMPLYFQCKEIPQKDRYQDSEAILDAAKNIVGENVRRVDKSFFKDNVLEADARQQNEDIFKDEKV